MQDSKGGQVNVRLWQGLGCVVCHVIRLPNSQGLQDSRPITVFETMLLEQVIVDICQGSGFHMGCS